MDIYEVGVYMALIVVASVCVFGIMWLLMRSMQPKRHRRRPAVAAAAAGKAAPKQVPQESSDAPDEDKKNKNKKNKKEKKKKESKVREEKLLKLKELPDNRLLPSGKAVTSSQDASKGAENGVTDKAIAESKAETPVAGEDKNKEGSAGEEAAANQENADINLPDLPSLDTLTTEDEAPKEVDLDLMSVFQNEDAEDSTTSDLAANLFDVDVENIEKLGSEVSEFLGGMRSK